MRRPTSIAPPKGTLGVLTPGIGAVSTTFMAGVELVRQASALPIGSVTQLATIRLGKRTEHRSPLSANSSCFCASLSTGHSGTARRAGPGIHIHRLWLWIPGSLASLGPRNDHRETGANQLENALVTDVLEKIRTHPVKATV